MAIIKFHEKAIAIYGVAQNSEGNSAIKSEAITSGTITTTIASTTVTGVSTKFSYGVTPGDGLGELAVGAYIYKPDYALVEFTALTNGQTLILGGLTWTAGVSGTTTAQLATAFESIAAGTAFGALSTRTGGGSFTAGTLTNWSTPAKITTTSVRFSPATVGTVASSLIATGTGSSPTITVTPGEIAGQIASIASQTSATLTANSSVAITGEGFRVGLGPKNAMATLNLNFSTELSTEAFMYTGSELSRDEQTVIKDKYAKFDFETFLPALGPIVGTDPVLTEVPYPDWFQSAGMAVVLSTGSQGKVTFTNSLSSNVFMTVEIRRASSDYTKDKVFQVSNMRGNLDLNVAVGTKTKLKWNFQGNLDGVFDKTKIIADFGAQKTEIAKTVSSQTVITSQLSLYSGITEPAYVSGTKSICFEKLVAPNFVGWDYSRYQTSCLDGWSKGAVPSDVTLTILEDKAEATYNPDNQIEANHALFLAYGNTTGFKVLLNFHNVQLAGVTSSKVANYAGQDLKFRSIGYNDIVLS